MAASRRFQIYVLKEARRNLAAEDYEAAFNHYLLAIKLNNHLYLEIHEEFVLCFCHWTDLLNCWERDEELVAAFSQAKDVCYFSINLIRALTEQALRLEQVSTAVDLIAEAEQHHPHSLSIKELKEQVAYAAVERWHFKMINDRQRNVAYRAAIQGCIKERKACSVLDIGCGTGLLSVFAEQAGAKLVVMCDACSVMTHICSAVTARHWQHTRTSCQRRIFHARSTRLSVPRHLPQRVDLVVTEIFDAALFGEHCLSTLLHAWSHLLDPQTGRVIPSSAQLYMCAIECPEIRKENQVTADSVPLLNLDAVTLLSKTGVAADEPYTTEDLYHIRNSYRYLSPIRPFLAVDFNSPQALQTLCSWESHFTLDIYAAGTVDALAVWFDLDLHEGVKVSTAPSATCCWEQAIFAVSSLQTDKTNTGGRVSPVVSCGDQLSICCSLRDDCLRLSVDKVVPLGFFVNSCHISGQDASCRNPGHQDSAARHLAAQTSHVETGATSQQALTNAALHNSAQAQQAKKEEKECMQESAQNQSQTQTKETNSFVSKERDERMHDLQENRNQPVQEERISCVNEGVMVDNCVLSKDATPCDKGELGCVSAIPFATVSHQLSQASGQRQFTSVVSRLGENHALVNRSCNCGQTVCINSRRGKTGKSICLKCCDSDDQTNQDRLSDAKTCYTFTTTSDESPVEYDTNITSVTMSMETEKECRPTSGLKNESKEASLPQHKDMEEKNDQCGKEKKFQGAEMLENSLQIAGDGNGFASEEKLDRRQDAGLQTALCHPLLRSWEEQHAQNNLLPDTFHLPREDIRRLNDQKLNSLTLAAIQTIRPRLQSPCPGVLSVCSGVPVGALMALKADCGAAHFVYLGPGDAHTVESVPGAQ